MPVKNLIPKITLSSSYIEDTLIPKLIRMVDQGEQMKGNWEQLHNDYWKMYLSIPDQEVKTFPWSRASNLFLPLTRITQDALMAQFFDAMLSSKPKVVGTEQGDLESARQLSMFYFDYVWEKILNLKEIGNDWLFDTLLDGTSAIKVRWDRSMQLIREQSVESRITTETITEEVLGEKVQAEIPSGVEQRIVEDLMAEPLNRPSIDHTDLSRVYVAPGTGMSLQYPECPWYFEELFLSWEQLQQRKRMGYENVDENLRSQLGENDITPQDLTKRDNDSISQSDNDYRTARVLVFYMRMVLPGEVTMPDGTTRRQKVELEDDDEVLGYGEDVEVTFFWDTKKIARIVPLSRIYPDGKRPHIDNRYVRIPRHFYGKGIPSRMIHMNRLINSAFNQMMDFGTLQNMPFFFYSPSETGLMPDLNPLRPGAGIPVLNPGGIQMPRLQGDKSFQLSIMQQIQGWAERDSSVTSHVLGANSATPNAPRTFRGQNQMIQQSNIAFSRMVALLAEPFLDMFRKVHLLYQKNAPKEMEFKYFNQETGLFKKQMISRQMFYEDVDFTFQLNPNRQFEQESNMMLGQFLMSIPFIQQIPQSVRALAKQLYESHGKKNFEEIWPEEQLQAQAMQQQAMQQQQGMPPGAPPEAAQGIPGMQGVLPGMGGEFGGGGFPQGMGAPPEGLPTEDVVTTPEEEAVNIA